MVYEQRWQQWKTLELEEESQLAESEFVIFFQILQNDQLLFIFLIKLCIFLGSKVGKN